MISSAAQRSTNTSRRREVTPSRSIVAHTFSLCNRLPGSDVPKTRTEERRAARRSYEPDPAEELVIMMVAGSLTALGTPASAAVAQILTSIPVTSSEGLEDAMKAAVNDVLDHAIALVPTVVDILLARR